MISLCTKATTAHLLCRDLVTNNRHLVSKPLHKRAVTTFVYDILCFKAAYITYSNEGVVVNGPYANIE